MSFAKTACVVSLGSAVALVAVLLAADVRAGDEDDTPTVVVDEATIAQASAFAGEFTFVGGQKQRDGLDAAIETAMDAVSPMVRGIGRKRLHETNPIPKRLTIAVNGQDVDIQFDGFGHSAGLDNQPVRAASPEGDKIKVSHRIRGSKLIELLDGDKGDRRNTFKLSSDGQRLTVDVEISSSHLPVPVVYELTFKRK